MSDARRTGEEPAPCMWFALCDNTTDIEVDHSIMGWTACCEGCCHVVGITPPPPIVGWRVRTTFTENGWPREKTTSFSNPLKSKCLSNIQRDIELWHPKAEDIKLEVLSPIIQGAGWGNGAWAQTFKKEQT